jgi:type I restriction enzyme S subunit
MTVGLIVYEIAELIEQRVLEIGDGYRAKNSELSSAGLPFARAGNVDGGFHFEESEKFPLKDISRVGNKVSAPGDVVFTSKGTVGRFAFVTDETPPFVYSPQLCFWRSVDTNKLDPRFLFCWVRGSEFRAQADAVKGQTDMADYVSLRDQRRIRITLPQILEQRSIASILGALDDKIELNRRMNRTLEDLATTLFRSWFVDFDPVVAKAAGRKPAHLRLELSDLFPAHFQDSEVGPIPRGWEVKTIEELARYVNGGAFTKGASGKGRMVIRIAELNSGPGGSTVYSDIDVAPEHLARPSDLLFAWSGSLDVYRWYRDEAIINQHIFKVVCEKYPQWFVHEQLREAMPFFQDIAADKATTMGHIKREHLSQALLAAPPKGLLDAADKILQPLYDKQLANERESLTLAALRDTLLPKLLSGELRVKAAEKLINQS